MKFEWDMTEKDWEQYVKEHKSHDERGEGFYGCCRVGKLKADFQHTLDTSAWYPYANVFLIDKDTGYGETGTGRPYDLLDSDVCIPIKSKTFEAFKQNFEKNFEKGFCHCDESYEPTVPLSEWIIKRRK